MFGIFAVFRFRHFVVFHCWYVLHADVFPFLHSNNFVISRFWHFYISIVVALWHFGILTDLTVLTCADIFGIFICWQFVGLGTFWAICFFDFLAFCQFEVLARSYFRVSWHFYVQFVVYIYIFEYVWDLLAFFTFLHCGLVTFLMFRFCFTCRDPLVGDWVCEYFGLLNSACLWPIIFFVMLCFLSSRTFLHPGRFRH